ncbi:MAG TPA: DUF1614 domain-containing protein [Nitrococcus sp.]|nr:DUF1614 domain-containing protein [Nitrococcus sp.]
MQRITAATRLDSPLLRLHHSKVFPFRLILATLLFAVLFTLIQVGLLRIAFDKLGLSADSAMLLLICSLLGSTINLPLFQLSAEPPPDPGWQPPLRLNPRLKVQPGKVIVALNVGGGLIPIAFSLFLLTRNPLPPGQVVLAVGVVATVCYFVSRPIPQLGIGMPIFVAPITAALMAMLLLPHQSAPLAYICGTIGVLMGADLGRLKDIRRLGAPVASIGGAGTFDGIFITGIVAVLLA